MANPSHRLSLSFTHMVRFTALSISLSATPDVLYHRCPSSLASAGRSSSSSAGAAPYILLP